MNTILRNGNNFNNIITNSGSITNCADIEFTLLTMVKDQGHKYLNNESGFQSDDELANSMEMNTNNSFEMSNQQSQKYNDVQKLNDGSKKENITLTNGRQKTVCYDFIKGNCRRRFCRFPHVMSVDQVVFCHDFQNNGCFRNACRFIHRSIDDEQFYRQEGSFPPHAEHIPPQIPAPTNVGQNQQPSFQQNPPHMLQPYYRQREDGMPVHQNSPTQMYANQPAPQMPMQMAQNGRRRSYGMVSAPPDIVQNKRPHMDDSYTYSQQHPAAVQMNGEHGQIYGGFEPPQQPQPQQPQPNVTMAAPVTSATVTATPTTVTSVVIGEDVINIYRLYEEHNLLRRRVEINEERLQELRATNTYLLQQNEQLKRQSICSCTSTIVNPVTLTTTSQQQPPQQVLNAVSIAPVQMQATPIVSIASITGGQPTQIIASTPSLAITANATQGQQIALTSTQQPTQILGTSQITLTPAQSMGIINTSQPLAMSANATQPIISYPVMTHSILPH